MLAGARRAPRRFDEGGTAYELALTESGQPDVEQQTLRANNTSRGSYPLNTRRSLLHVGLINQRELISNTPPAKTKRGGAYC